MSDRIIRLVETIRPETYPLCIEMAQLLTESMKQTEGEPQVMRIAKAQTHFLNKRTIFIEDNELIVGNPASKPMGAEISFSETATGGGRWTQEGIKGLQREGWDISDKEKAAVKLIDEYWSHGNPQVLVSELLDEERLWPFTESGIYLPPFKTKEAFVARGVAQGGLGFGVNPDYASVDYGKVIKLGLQSYIDNAEKELKNIRYTSPEMASKAYFLKAVILVHNAMINHANRYAKLATQLSSEENNQTRKKDLQGIAEICRWVPANPPRTFYEAIQSFWFIYLMFISLTSPIQRFDQYMYPFYKKDIEAGITTDEEVLELLQCLRIKDMQFIQTNSNATREKWSGMAKWNNMVIGGVTPDGKDATNELSYLILEAAKRCPTPHHTITLRVHDGTPEALMLKALEVNKLGIGMPAYVGDKSNIDYLLSKDVPLELARDYYMNGCLDANVPEGCGSLNPMIATLFAFDIFLHNGINPHTGKQVGLKTGDLESFKTFDELMAAWKKQLTYFLGMEAEIRNLQWEFLYKRFAGALTASFFTDGIKVGKIRFDCELPYKLNQSMAPVGLINIADSLTAIKKLIFEDKKVTIKQLKEALAANWQGKDNEELHRIFLTAPKYGNDDDYADSIAKELYQFYIDTVESIDSPRGKKYCVSGITISAQGPAGVLTGATPDGRYAGEVTADGTMSPAQGRDTHGPIAIMKSAAKINQVSFQSNLLNMKFHPSALKSTEDMKKLSSLIKTYFSMGGKHVQFNVIDKKILLAAQEQPDKYRDVIVRVAGYSAYFIQLSKVIQADVMKRTELNLK